MRLWPVRLLRRLAVSSAAGEGGRLRRLEITMPRQALPSACRKNVQRVVRSLLRIGWLPAPRVTKLWLRVLRFLQGREVAVSGVEWEALSPLVPALAQLGLLGRVVVVAPLRPLWGLH